MKRTLFLSLGLAALTGGLFLALAQNWGGLGFPLDDAWIHQTYARNLAATGEWAYRPGQPSSGSTAPLWTMLLAAGYALRLDYRLWTYGLGVLLLGLTAWQASRLAARLFPGYPHLPVIVAVLTATEWHLVWAAMSGMETLLYALLALLILDLAVSSGNPSSVPQPQPSILWPVALGFLAGLLTVTRPEGIMLFGLAAGAVLVSRVGTGKGRVKTAFDAIGMAVAFAVPVVPALLFNYQHGAGWLPNTFYAKQIEYAAALAQPLLSRVMTVVTPILAGPLAIFAWTELLLLGRVVPSWVQAGDRRSWRSSSIHTCAFQALHRFLRSPVMLPLLWTCATILLYAWRLPVGYQHGRYILPVIPVLLVLGLGGLVHWGWPAEGPARHARGRTGLGRRVLRSGLAGAGLILAFMFVPIGARAYASDVQIVNSEMVTTAEWIHSSVPPGTLIAAHDIGALGYFTEQPLLDLAGLISPEVLPYLRDEPRLRQAMAQADAAYVVFFPNWYPSLAADSCLSPVFEGNAPWATAAGGEHLVVYRACWAEHQVH